MQWIKIARAFGGLGAIFTLLGLVAARAFDPSGVRLRPETVALLLGVISALLGVDAAAKRLPVEVKIGGGDDGD